MLFKKGTQIYAYEVLRDAGSDIMYVNYLGANFVPSIADSGEVMSRTIDSLIESPNISRIIFVQQRNYHYSFEQVSYLIGIAQLYVFLTRQEKILSKEKLALDCVSEHFPQRHSAMSALLPLIKQNPLMAYHELKKLAREQKILLETSDEREKYCIQNYLRLLEKIQSLFEQTSLIKKILSLSMESKINSREPYRVLFRPDIIPNFAFTRLVTSLPEDAEIIEQYDLLTEFEKTTVTILKKKFETRYLYHLIPEEYSLSESHHLLLNLAKNVLIEHSPKAEEFTDPERTRQVFFNVARDLVSELAAEKSISLTYKELNKLATILVRHTIGFGLLEVLLQDPNLQDITLNAPTSLNTIFVRHGKYDECFTNILPNNEDVESWAAKFRLLSGRPLDEAHPILDTELILGKNRARIAIIQKPLSPYGLAYALRRHREDPWTLPLFIKNKMLNPFSAGLLSFLIDGNRTLLVAGTRSSGKTSLLQALMLEIMPNVRVLVVEDTLEIPTDAMRKLGYDILRMKVRSALLQETNEVSADEGIRTSLRFGDSALIIGEVRSSEAKALYESMRIGALANVVAGTIHGASPYGVFDRVVNDLQVPVTSFKATDLILVANPIKTADGLHSKRRLIQITEVRKHWKSDPLNEAGFIDLMRYDVEKDELIPTDDLINGNIEVIKNIASNVKGWAGNWDAVYDNILLRGKIKQEIVETADALGMPELLEAPFTVLSNAAFHNLSDKVLREYGLPLSDKVFPLWKEWLKSELKKM